MQKPRLTDYLADQDARGYPDLRAYLRARPHQRYYPSHDNKCPLSYWLTHVYGAQVTADFATIARHDGSDTTSTNGVLYRMQRDMYINHYDGISSDDALCALEDSILLEELHQGEDA